MRTTPTSQRAGPEGAVLESCREGRDCARSHRLTVLTLFPRMDARPGAWLVFLAAMCSFVAIRALELGHF